MAFAQSPPSQSHAEVLQLVSQYLSRIQLGGQPSAQLGTGQERYIWEGGSRQEREMGRKKGGRRRQAEGRNEERRRERGGRRKKGMERRGEKW